jgi:hypothetical protein
MNVVAAARKALEEVVAQLGRTEAHLVALIEATLKNDVEAVVAATAALDATARHLNVAAAAAAAAVAVARREDGTAAAVLDALVEEVKRAGQRVREAQQASQVVVGRARDFHGAYSRALHAPPTAQGGAGAGYTRRAAVAASPVAVGALHTATV